MHKEYLVIEHGWPFVVWNRDVELVGEILDRERHYPPFICAKLWNPLWNNKSTKFNWVSLVVDILSLLVLSLFISACLELRSRFTLRFVMLFVAFNAIVLAALFVPDLSQKEPSESLQSKVILNRTIGRLLGPERGWE